MTSPPSAFDRLLGALFLLVWRAVGLLALPALVLHPRTRRHVWRVPGPEPGWTWLHGASAGEHRVVAALAPHLPPTVWRTRSSLRTPVAKAFPSPMDVPFVARAWIRRHRPGRLVLVESELWPGWLATCRALGVPVCVVHSRDSRGTARWRQLGPVWRWMMHGVEVVPQSETGDLKLAAPVPPAALTLPRPCLIAASTREGDEARILAAWSRLHPRPHLVLAPRHLARAGAVAQLANEAGARVQRRTAGGPITQDVLVLDTLGELAGLFRQADAAVIGGTWTAALGGHSPAEALATGVPVVGGPERAGNPEAWRAGHTWESPDDPALLAEALTQALATGRVEPPARDAAQRAVARLPQPRLVSEQAARPALWPLVPLVRGVARRRSGWRGDPVRVGAPVVSIGGLTAGGSGKTAVVAWLLDALALEGVWVVSRGYRRDPSGPEIRVGVPHSPPNADLGDELEMLRRRGVPVVSAPDRVAGAREAAARGASLILVDDGFQYRRLHRDLDVVCLDARWPGGEGPIPVGTRREPWSGLTRAHWLWHHNVRSLSDDVRVGPPGLPQVRSVVRPVEWRTPDGPAPLQAVSGRVRVHTGLARPSGLLCQLVRLGLDVEVVETARDHGALHHLQPGDVVSEKDAARLPPQAPVRVLHTTLEVVGARPLLARIRALVTP